VEEIVNKFDLKEQIRAQLQGEIQAKQTQLAALSEQSVW